MVSKHKKTKQKAVRIGDLPMGDQVILWIEEFLRVPEGRYVGQKIELRKWQKDEIKRIYNNKHGTRRAILSFGRKNGKTALAAMLVLVHLIGPTYVLNSHLYSAAQSREQAAIVFNLAAKMVNLNDDLAQYIAIRYAHKELFCKLYGTTYRALSAEASTAFGLSPVFIIHDELGQVRGPQSHLYEALETATAANERPLSIIISTQAPNDGDLLSILIDDALAENDPHTLVRLYTAPNEDDPFAEATIRKANPAFGDFQTADEVIGMANDARRMPSRENEYRNLILNQRVEAHSPFISKSVWQSCGADTLPFESDTRLFGGLDLSSTNDLTALVLVGKPKDAKAWHVHPTFWLPAEGIHERSRNDRVSYDVWARNGFLHTVPGKSIEYEYVAEYIAGILDRYTVSAIAFDRWMFKQFRPWLLKAGIEERKIEKTFIEAGQGFQWMSPALRETESALLNQRIAHGNHPVLTWNANNAVVISDPAGNRKLAKNRSTGRIDGMVALAMAIGVTATQLEAPEPAYQMFSL